MAELYSERPSRAATGGGANEEVELDCSFDPGDLRELTVHTEPSAEGIKVEMTPIMEAKAYPRSSHL